MRCAIFDVDGTLVDGSAADGAYVSGIRSVFGSIPIDEDWSSYATVTSERVLDEIVHRALGRAVSPFESRAVQDWILDSLAAAPVREVAGARAFLERLARSGWALAIASGDWESSARLKLARVGISSEDLPAAFCGDGDTREAIMRSALQRACAAYRCAQFESVVYVGDGSWDFRAAQELQWDFVGIASGTAAAALTALGAKHVFADYREPDAVVIALSA